MRILLTGGSGLLGYSVHRFLTKATSHELIAPTHQQMDITDRDAVQQFLTAIKPDAVLHCAAYSKVDLAESEKAICRRINIDGTRHLAQICHTLGCQLVYISSDYVFDGKKSGYYETGDPCAPLSVYGETKAEAEKLVLMTDGDNCVVRTSWLFGQGANFADTILRLSQTHEVLDVVCDQVGSPTYAEDLAPLLVSVCKERVSGILHATNEGVCSWAEYAVEILRLCGSRCCIEPVLTNAYPTVAIRPQNSRLSKESLDKAGFARLPHWRDALKHYFATYKIESMRERLKA